MCSSEYCIWSKVVFLGKNLIGVLLLRGRTGLFWGQCMLLMCNQFCGILVKLHLLLGCSKIADMTVSEIKQHYWDLHFTDLHFDFNFCDISPFELGDGFLYILRGRKKNVVLYGIMKEEIGFICHCLYGKLFQKMEPSQQRHEIYSDISILEISSFCLVFSRTPIKCWEGRELMVILFHLFFFPFHRIYSSLEI